MRDPDRILGIVHALNKLWDLRPDWRLGQLIANVLRDPTTRATDLQRIFYVEDDETLRLIRALIADIEDGNQ
jgi:hypothetical protein